MLNVAMEDDLNTLPALTEERVSPPPQESPISRPPTRSSSRTKWELGWQDPESMLKISVFKDGHSKRSKGAPKDLREKIQRMEQALLRNKAKESKRSKSSSSVKKSRKFLEIFRRVVRSVMLLLRCFRRRRKFAIQSKYMTLTHREETERFEVFKTSSVSLELRMIMSTPPEHRTKEDLRKVQFYLRASGASRLLASASTTEDLDNLSRYVAYERYETERVVVQQGRTPDRFYVVITGKMLVVREYHIDSGTISKTVGVLTKGMTTNVEEMEQRTLRPATLICRGPVETLVLDSDDYFLVHGERGGAPKEFLSRHNLFKAFPFHSLHIHKHHVRLQYYPKGSIVFGGASEFEWIYVVKSGECSLVRVQMVSDLKRHNNSMFNKRTIEELGCQRVKRSQSSAEKLASLQLWRPDSKPTTSQRPRTQQRTPASREQKENSRLQNENSFLSNITDATVNDRTLPDEVIKKDDQKHSVREHVQGEMKPQPAPILSKSVYSSSKTAFADSRFKKKSIASKSAPPILRQAYLELGKLKPGDVLGLESTPGQMEDLEHVRLISDTDSEVVLLHRKFFLRHAPSSLLSQVSFMTTHYPGIEKARSDHETREAWTIYKSSVSKMLASRRNNLVPRKDEFRSTPSSISSKPNQPYFSSTSTTRQFISPGTADRSKSTGVELSPRARRKPKLYTNLTTRGREPSHHIMEGNIKAVSGVKIALPSS